MKVETVKAASLLLDYTFYIRGRIGSVANLVAALAAGLTLPPITVDRKSRRVVDGFHRLTAHLRHFGPDAKIAVIFKDYKSEKEMLADVMALNATHGRPLSNQDRLRCVELGRLYNLSVKHIAAGLNMTPDRLTSMVKERTAYLGKQRIPLKPALRHRVGKKLTKAQAAVNEKMGGGSQAFYANQLILLISNKLVDTENANVMGKLRTLHELLDGLLVEKV